VRGGRRDKLASSRSRRKTCGRLNVLFDEQNVIADFGKAIEIDPVWGEVCVGRGTFYAGPITSLCSPTSTRSLR
jgi:hypothetical protein